MSKETATKPYGIKISQDEMELLRKELSYCGAELNQVKNIRPPKTPRTPTNGPHEIQTLWEYDMATNWKKLLNLARSLEANHSRLLNRARIRNEGWF